MKNYYKILGVKKDASDEKIREHWVRLMRKLHPDQRTEGGVGGERIKEVNEAYQVLKYSSTRMEYDLRMAYDRKKRGSYSSKVSVSIGIFVALVIVCAVSLKKSQVSTQKVLTAPDKTYQMSRIKYGGQTNPIEQISQKNEINQKNRKDPKEQTNQISSTASSTLKPERSCVLNEDNDLNVIRTEASTHPLIDASTPPRTESIDATTQQRIVLLTADRSNQPNEINQADQTNRVDQINQTEEKDQIDQKDPSTHPRVAASTPPPIETSAHLIATEEEVRQFFAKYTERYTQKDLDGLLSLFSPRAVQNRQDGLEGIRKIYGKFFDWSEEVKYALDNIRIEIYQNAVEAKARYEIVQALKKSGEKKIWRGDIRWTLIKEAGALKVLSLDYQPQTSY